MLKYICVHVAPTSTAAMKQMHAAMEGTSHSHTKLIKKEDYHS